MLVTTLEAVSKTRTRVTFDYDRTLVLSNKEIAAYGLQPDQEIDAIIYQEIVDEQRRASLVRAGNLLKGMDYTVHGMRDKLIRAGYTEEAVEDTIIRLQDAGYLDDRRYAETYLRIHLQDRSLARIRNDLLHKGIGRDLLADVMESYEEDNEGGAAALEIAQIRKILARKHYAPETMSYEEIGRIKASILRKGYSMERVHEAMEDVN